MSSHSSRKFDEDEALSRAQDYFVKIRAKSQQALSCDPQDTKNVKNTFPDPPKRQSRQVKVAPSLGEKLPPLPSAATTPSKRKCHPETHHTSTDPKKASNSNKAVDRPSASNKDNDKPNTTPPKTSITNSTTKMLTRSQRKGAGMPIMDSVLSSISATTSPTKNDGKNKSNTPSKRKVPPQSASISEEVTIIGFDHTPPKRGRHSIHPEKIYPKLIYRDKSDKKNKLLSNLPRAPTVTAPIPTDSDTLLRSILCDPEATTEGTTSARMPSTNKRLPRPPSSKLLLVSQNNTSSDGIAISLSMIQQPVMNIPSSSLEQKPVPIFPSSVMDISTMKIDPSDTSENVPSLRDEDNDIRHRTRRNKLFDPLPMKSDDDNVVVNGLEVIKNSFMVDFPTTNDGDRSTTAAIIVDTSPSFRLMHFIGIFVTFLIAMYLSTPAMGTTTSIQPIIQTVQTETDIVKAISETTDEQLRPMVSSWSVASVQEQLEP